jgi:sugar lactone lactonase YvrE
MPVAKRAMFVFAIEVYYRAIQPTRHPKDVTMEAHMARMHSAAALAIVLAGAFTSAATAQETLFQSRRLTPKTEYTKGIEGPGVDRAGNLFVVNFGEQGTIGKVPAGATKSEFVTNLPPGPNGRSIGNAIRFDREGRMYVADFKNHKVFVVAPGGNVPKEYFKSNDFHQPNDLTVATDGTLYASDPPRSGFVGGQVWRITRGPNGTARGEVMTSERPLARTNGIDLSPDEKTLYVGESEKPLLCAYRVEGTRLTEPRLVKKFTDPNIDGLRTDIDGRIFVARLDKGTVEVLPPDGTMEREIHTLGKEPNNLAFGGPDGRTVFVTQSQDPALSSSAKLRGYIETFRVERPGREFCLQKADPSDASCQPRPLPPAPAAPPKDCP